MTAPRSLSHGVTSIGLSLRQIIFLGVTLCGSSFVLVESAYAPLMGVTVKAVDSGASVDLGSFLKEGSSSTSNKGKNLLVLGTYAADFNAIEYAQRLQHYVPILKEKHGVEKVGFVLNCETDAAEKLADMVDLNTNDVTLMVDPLGKAGRAFGVGRGWREEDEEMSPFLKLFGMLFGLGAWATLPAVIGGYIGNPWVPQPWIETALAVGQVKGRWPNTALELDENNNVEVNKFAELPYVGEWKRRPLELATLRLQNMLDISIKNWKELAPSEEALKAGVLTQLGGCVVYDPSEESIVFEWRDPGICAVANFESILKKLPTTITSATEDEPSLIATP